MYKQAGYPSDSESVSSETSDVTSRRTTPSESWTNTTLQQQQINRLNIQLNEDDQCFILLSTSASDNTVISKKTNMQNTNDNQSNQVTSLNQQQQQTWINPYWNSNGNAGVEATQSGTNNTNLQYSSSPRKVQQLIPGSILINDRGEIDNSSSNQNKRLDSSTSSNFFNPGGKYISDDSGGPGGYLVPTHIQRRIVTSSPGLTAHPEDHFGYKRSHSSSDADAQNRPEFTRQQTFPVRTDNNIQPWVNPYWPKSNQNNSQSTQQNNTIENKHSQPSNNSKQTTSTESYSGMIISEKSTSSTNTWENPYWKDTKTQTSTVSKQEDQSWENPYWKDTKTQTSTVSKQEDQSWENPYWKDSKSQTSTTPKQESQSWENPYWKDTKTQTSTVSKQKGQSWENPYWKDTKTQTSTVSKQEGQSWENPYWKDSKPQTLTVTKQEGQSWENPYWKDKNTSNQYVNGAALKESLPSEYKVPVVPAFYKRIYPSDTPNIKHETVISSETPKKIINDNEDLLYTIDNQGIAHYRAGASSPRGTNKTVNFAPAPKISQYPVSSPDLPSPPLTAQTSNAVSPPHPPSAPATLQAPNSALLSQNTSSSIPLFSNLDNYPSTSFNYLSSTSFSLIVLTEEELNDIQHALHLLATNPDAIPVVETFDQLPSSNISYHNNPPLPLASLSTGNQQQQSHQQLPPSSLTVNQQQQPPSSAFSLASLSTGNQQQQPPSSSASLLASLSSVNQQQQPPPSLLTGNRQQQPHQQSPPPPSSSSLSLFSQNVQLNSSPHVYDSNSQQSALFSTPSYPSDSNEALQELIRKGSVVLI